MSDLYGDLLKQLRALVQGGDLNTALIRICNMARYMSASVLPGRPMSSPGLDQLCQQIGAAAAAKNSTASSGRDAGKEENCYLVTELAPVGGHSRLLEDLICLQPGRRHRVLITNLFDVPRANVLPDFIAQAADECLVAPAGTAIEKLNWVQNELRASNPSRLILLNHWNDAVAVAAAQPGAMPCLFVHHVDHLFCLGVHVPHFVHVDLFPLRFHACRNELGLSRNIYWPCTVPDRGARDPVSLGREGKALTTCTSGNSNKFMAPYPLSYFQAVPKIIEATGGTHVHVGPLPEANRNEILAGLRKQAIDARRFVYIQWVRSLWDTLAEQRVDLYISSFPAAGGRAMIEALGSGTPVLGHRHLHEAVLSDFHALYPDALIWHRPEELFDALRSLSPAVLRQHSLKGRQWYEAQYRPELLAKALEEPEAAAIVPAQRADTWIDPVAGHLWPERLCNVLQEKTDLIKLLDSMGAAECSVECLREIVQLCEPVALAFLDAGNRYLARGNIAAAVRMLTRAAEVDPASAAIRTALGEALLMAGERAAAEMQLRRALELNPAEPKAQELLDALPAQGKVSP